jgi:hypothetical protein
MTMKARKVAINLEVLTSIPVKELRAKELLTLQCSGYASPIEIVQVGVNVFKPAKGTAKRRK